MSYLSKEDLLAIYGVPVTLYGPDGKLLKAETVVDDPFSSEWADNNPGVFASEYMGSFEPKPLDIADIEAMRGLVVPMWSDRTPRVFTAQEYAGIGTLGLNALAGFKQEPYMPKDLWYRRTCTPEWREGVRKRLSTGLDDAPVLP